MTPRQESDSRESSPARRPNARTSCDVCKRMKIKCEREGDSCLHCIERGSQCETTLVERKRRQVKRVDPGSIVEMENRIKRLEAVIVASGLSGQSGSTESHSDTEDTPPFETTSVTDRLSTLLINDEGSSHFLGPSSGFSLFSPHGLQWISERTGNTDLKNFIKSSSKSQRASQHRGKNILFLPMPASERLPLPPKEVADPCVRCFFETFNMMLPLYDRDTFEEYYARHYTADPPTGAAWYASINIVVAMGGMISRVHSQGIRPDAFHSKFHPAEIEELQSSKYFRNATSCFIELTFEEPSLMAVQAICGLAFIQQMSLQPHPYNMLASTASRMAYSIGLHRKVDETGLSESQMNQRNNVFWIVYIMDKAVSLRLGHPSVLNDDDIEVDLPKDHQQFLVDNDGSRIYGIFKCQVQLAMIESRIYTNLYSVKAHRRSALERLRLVGQLDKDLQDWRMTVPIDIRPDEIFRCSKDQFPPVFLMHFEFFNCVSTIHRISVHHRGPWTSENLAQVASTLHTPRLNPRVYSSQSICLAAARGTITLLQYVDMSENFGFGNFIWTQIYYPLSAFLLLFANIIQNPEDPSAAADLQLMDLVISVVAPMLVQSGPFTTTAAVELFRELRNVAKRFVENRMLQQTKKTKREYNSDVPKDGEYHQPVAVVAEPYTTMPQMHVTPQPSFTPFIAHPLKANTQQYAPQLVDGFREAPNLPPHDQPMIPVDDAGFPTLGFDAFMFSENFEWDLADLWNKEYSPNANIE